MGSSISSVWGGVFNCLMACMTSVGCRNYNYACMHIIFREENLTTEFHDR